MTQSTVSARPPRASDRAGASPADRVVSAMPYVLLGALLLVVVRRVSVPVSNPDTFFHLRYGHEFLNGWALRHPGHVSTLGQRDWVPTQWASQVAMAATESAFGLAGVVWLTGLVVLLTVLGVFLVARSHADPLPAVVVTIAAVIGTIGSMSPRPQVVSYALILLCTHLWLRTAQDLRPRWWLVPLTWAWAALHGMWPVGIVIGVVAVIGISMDHGLRTAEQRRRVLVLLAVPALSLLAAALTPVGPRLYSAVLLVGGRAQFHDEWASTDFHDAPALVAAGLILVTLVVWVRGGAGQRPAWTPLLLLLLATAWSAYSIRTVPVAVMVTVPLVAGALQTLNRRRRAAPRREAWLVAGIGVLAALALTATVPFTAGKPASVPGWLDPALARLPAGTTVQTTDQQAGYFLWRHPALNPVIDGYSDAYTTAHLQAQLDLQQLHPGWDRTLRKDEVDYAVLPTKSPLAYALTHAQRWRTLHTSRDLVMLEPPGKVSP